MFLKISNLFLICTIVSADKIDSASLHDEKVLIQDYSKLKQVSNHMFKRIQQLDQSNIRKISAWPTFRSKFHDYEYEDDQKFGPFDNSFPEDDHPPAPPPSFDFSSHDNSHPPAPPNFDPSDDDEHHQNNIESGEPSDFRPAGNDEPEQKIESVPVREFCASGQENIQLGPCSATFVHCMDFATTYEYKDSPLESVFVHDTFRKATEVPECFDSEINRLNEATEKLAISVNFCDQGSGVYRASLEHSDGECSRQALLCDKHREPLSISCASSARPLVFTCQDQHIFHNGNCVKPWETDGQCARCKPNEKRRAPNCHQYYQCVGDSQTPQLEWKLHECPQGHYFETANQSCTISDGRCASVSECRDGDSYSPSCGDYILCVGGKFMLGNCPHLTRWDGRQRRCVQDADCKRYLETHCRHGDVIPSYDCKSYQICRNGRFAKESCLNGKTFLEPCRECENKFQACHARYENQNYKPLTCVHGEKIIDTTDCRRYVECIQGEWYSMECRQGTFDPNIRSCTNKQDQQCGYESLDQPMPPQSQPVPSPRTIYLPADNQNILQDFRVESAHSSPVIPQNYSSNYAQTDFLYEHCDVNSPQLVPHPYDCSKYKQCDQTRGYYIEVKCNEHEQFDWKQGQCRRWFQCKAPSCVEGMRLPKDECGKAKRCQNGVWEDVRCKNEMAFMNGRCSQTVSCKNTNHVTSYGKNHARCFHGDTKSHPKYCSRFYLCAYGEFLEVECLDGQKYNPESKRCDPQYNCPSEYQPSCYHGDTKPVEDKCDQFLSCVDGEYQLKFCPYGEKFDQEQRRCETGSCQYNQDVGNDAPNDSCHESPLPSGYRAHPTDCNRFYQCAHGKWVPKTCPANLAFNSALAVCDWPSNVLGCSNQ